MSVQTHQSSVETTPPAAHPLGLPDVNTLQSPYGQVQESLDRTTYLNFYADPVIEHRATAHLTPEDRKDYFGINGGYGVSLRSRLHPFESVVESASPSRGISIQQGVAPMEGSLRGRLFFARPDAPWTPGKWPPPGMMDPWASQPASIPDLELSFGGGDSVHVYAVGRTHPDMVAGRPRLFFGAVGNIVRGQGRFQGLEGTVTLNGHLHELGFRGLVCCRIADPRGTLRTEREHSAPSGAGDPDSTTTFIVLRGEKEHPAIRTEYGTESRPERVVLATPAKMRSASYRFGTHGRDRLRGRMSRGPVVGHLEARVILDILAPPGTPDTPNWFTTHNTYCFFDRNGQPAGTIVAEVRLGKSFSLELAGLPGQPAMRYGGVGPIVGGTGVFEGVTGLLNVNSAIGITPHALSMLNALQIFDPDGQFRSAAGGPS